jgi:hypothetical protein
MQSKARTVTAYLGQVPATRRSVLTKLRELCVQGLVGYQEVVEYGLPGYSKNGKVEIAFASQRVNALGAKELAGQDWYSLAEVSRII